MNGVLFSKGEYEGEDLAIADVGRFIDDVISNEIRGGEDDTSDRGRDDKNAESGKGRKDVVLL